MDFKWLEAYQITQDEICPQCGNPIWLCRSTDDRIAWHEETSVCQATRQRELKHWRDTHKKSPSKQEREAAGRISFMVPSVLGSYPEGTQLPTREDYYRGR